MKRILFLITVLALASIAAYADIARPDKTPVTKSTKSVNTSLTILLRSDATEAKLRIPKSQIKQLRAELEQLDDDADTSAAVTNFSRTQTIASGSLLSLAFVFGGIWFVRSGKAATKAGKTLAVLAVVSAIGLTATFVYANAGPPPGLRSITGKTFSDAVQSYGRGYGKIRLETKPDSEGGGVELIVPDPKDEKSKSEEE